MSSKIPYTKTEFFNNLIVDFISNKENILNFINEFPNLKNFETIINQKSLEEINRDTLVSRLKKQNKKFKISKETLNNINSLSSKNTFTITTGHQLCLFTGPLYFTYKVIGCINLCQNLKEKYPKYNFVPIFWLASEDHDIDEISSININGKNVKWETEYVGPSGKATTKNFSEYIQSIKNSFGNQVLSEGFKEIFFNPYLENKDLSSATLSMLNKLFGKYGLVCIDANALELKKRLVKIAEKDIKTKKYTDIIKKTSKQLASKYHNQVNVSDDNFFAMRDGERVKVTKENFSEIKDISKEISPNVLFRPVYQELILPNIGYIGGPAEIAYWMQLKGIFSEINLTFPILILRNSLFIIDKKIKINLSKLNLSADKFLKNLNDIEKKIIISENNFDELNNENQEIEKIFDAIKLRFKDLHLEESINSEYQKVNKSIKKISKKIVRGLKKRNEILINRVEFIRNRFTPKNSLQERNDSLIQYYAVYGENFMKMLKDNLNPLDNNFLFLETDD